MPIYPYVCQDCGHYFEKLSRTFEVQEVSCPECKSQNNKRQMTVPYVRMGGIREPGSAAQERDSAIDAHARRGDFGSASREAEKSGMDQADVNIIRKGGEWRD